MAVAVTPRRAAAAAPSPLRILTAVPICDGHDSAVSTINMELARHGLEVIYLGYHCPVATIVRAAIQEDVHVVGISSYNGGHIVFFKEVVDQLRALGAGDIPVFGGGGGTITKADERVMQRQGTDRIFHAGTPLNDIMALIRREYGRVLKPNSKLKGDRALARAITVAECRAGSPNPAGPGRLRASRATLRASPFDQLRALSPSKSSQPTGGVSDPALQKSGHVLAAPKRSEGGFVVGVAGPGGAGKSTLIDELTSRFLEKNPRGRIAILANDPSHPDTGGAILGDRVSMLYAQDDRVFFRSLATRGSLTGLSAAAPAAIELLRASGEFDLILVESVGIGQESDPFGLFGKKQRLVDAMLFVLAPYYGGRIQLQKIGLLNGADLVAINKCDHPMAHTARAEIAARLEANGKGQRLFATVAAKHQDPGVDALYATIASLGKLYPEPAGGEKACQLVVAP